jgi:uncharacterized protein YjiS (DUF1127 family)
MRPYYFDIDQARTRSAAAIVTFERAARRFWPPPPRRRGPGEWLAAAVAVLGLWRQRVRGRRELARLDLRLLRDIGVTPNEADSECGKPFWRA